MWVRQAVCRARRRPNLDRLRHGLLPSEGLSYGTGWGTDRQAGCHSPGGLRGIGTRTPGALRSVRVRGVPATPGTPVQPRRGVPEPTDPVADMHLLRARRQGEI